MGNTVPMQWGRSYHQFVPPVDYFAYHDPDSPAKLSTTLVHALADIMGIDVTDTGDALHHSIDLDALDHIFPIERGERPPALGHIAFSVDGYRVTIYRTGQIVITPPQ